MMGIGIGIDIVIVGVLLISCEWLLVSRSGVGVSGELLNCWVSIMCVWWLVGSGVIVLNCNCGLLVIRIMLLGLVMKVVM